MRLRKWVADTWWKKLDYRKVEFIAIDFTNLHILVPSKWVF